MAAEPRDLMSTADAQPHLRLVGAADWWGDARTRARRAVADENRAAATNRGLSPTDPRWALAARAYSQLQGSALTQERRLQVMRTARRLGVRPFDANLIIAIVQDQARRGRGLREAAGTIPRRFSPDGFRVTVARHGPKRAFRSWLMRAR